MPGADYGGASGGITRMSSRSRLKPLLQVPMVALFLLPAGSPADTTDDEIDYLIDSVSQSHCVFIRNGKRYTGRDARQHLRSKNRLNSHLIDTTEEFIEKIASRSVMSGKPYLIACRGADEQPLGDWLTARLADYRHSRS